MLPIRQQLPKKSLKPMKVKLKTLAAALLLSCGALPAAAQTDVTDQYLKNAGFDANFDYPASATGNVK